MKLWFLAGIAACLLQPAHAYAYPQSMCGPEVNVEKRLIAAGERPIVRYADGDVAKTLWGNERSGTWTLTATQFGGYTCTMRHGTGLVLVLGDPA